jgi:hypothetical protein
MYCVATRFISLIFYMICWGARLETGHVGDREDDGKIILKWVFMETNCEDVSWIEMFQDHLQEGDACLPFSLELLP